MVHMNVPVAKNCLREASEPIQNTCDMWHPDTSCSRYNYEIMHFDKFNLHQLKIFTLLTDTWSPFSIEGDITPSLTDGILPILS